MPDRFADDNAAYREALNRAYENAEVEEVPTETPAEVAPVEPLIETESSEAPVVEETEPTPQTLLTGNVTEADTSEETPAEKLLAGKYKSPEELERAYLEAQSVIGRRDTEKDALRESIDQLREQMAKPVEQPHVAVTTDEILEDPAAATVRAFAQKDERALDRAYRAWQEEDSTAAALWLSETRASQREAALRSEIAAVRGEVQTLSVPQQEAAQREEWNTAFSIVLAKSPDFGEHAARILEEVAPQYPNILGALSSGDAKAKAEILTALYAIDRAQTEDPAKLRETLNEEAREAAEEARQAREGAKVLTQATTGGDAPEQSPEELEAERTKQRYAAQTGGWNANWVGRKTA